MLISFVVVQFAPGGPIEQVISDLTGNSNNDQLGGAGSDFAGGGNGIEEGQLNSKYRGAQGLDPDLDCQTRKAVRLRQARA